jgi:hypothetical protein
MIANRELARRLDDLKSDPGFEPLSMLIEKRNECVRGIANLGCNLGDVVEADLWPCIQNVVFLERSKTVDLLPWRQTAGTRASYHSKSIRSEASEMLGHVGV